MQESTVALVTRVSELEAQLAASQREVNYLGTRLAEAESEIAELRHPSRGESSTAPQLLHFTPAQVAETRRQLAIKTAVFTRERLRRRFLLTAEGATVDLADLLPELYREAVSPTQARTPSDGSSGESEEDDQGE